MNEVVSPSARHTVVQPQPYVDRAALSEAWYRALYGSQRGEPAHVPAPSATGPSPHASAGAHAAVSRGAALPAQSRMLPAARGGTARLDRQPQGVVRAMRVRAERAAPPSLAARTWRAAVARRTALAIVLPDGEAVRVLVQQRGRRVHVSATRNGSVASIAAGAALLRARVTLAAHGIQSDVDSRRGTS